jgi:hypothetical protein
MMPYTKTRTTRRTEFLEELLAILHPQLSEARVVDPVQVERLLVAIAQFEAECRGQ